MVPLSDPKLGFFNFSREKKNDFIDVFGRFLHALLEEKLVYKNEYLQGLYKQKKWFMNHDHVSCIGLNPDLMMEYSQYTAGRKHPIMNI